MAMVTEMTSQFIRSANVRNLVFVLLIVVTGIIKPSGAIMV